MGSPRAPRPPTSALRRAAQRVWLSPAGFRLQRALGNPRLLLAIPLALAFFALVLELSGGGAPDGQAVFRTNLITR